MQQSAEAHNQENLSFRAATASDIPQLKKLVLEHGEREWNKLSEEQVSKHLDGVAEGDTLGIVATLGSEVVGFATYLIGKFFPQYEQRAKLSDKRGYIAEAVVHGSLTSAELGALLLEECKCRIGELGISTIYIDRHEQNSSSAGMMKQAGFEEIDTFPDPDRPVVGSGKTTVCRFQFSS